MAPHPHDPAPLGVLTVIPATQPAGTSTVLPIATGYGGYGYGQGERGKTIMLTRCPERDCGRVYDDAQQWTLCPHNPLDVGPGSEHFCFRCDLRAPCPCGRATGLPSTTAAEQRGTQRGTQWHAQARVAHVVWFLSHKVLGTGYWTETETDVAEARHDFALEGEPEMLVVERRELTHDEWLALDHADFAGW